MSAAEQLPTVQEAVARVAATLGPIPKGDRMTEGPAKYSYRGIESILAKAGPLLHAAGVVLTPRVLRRDVDVVLRGRDRNEWRLVTLLVEYEITGPAGDTLTVTTCGEGLDPADKAANKAMTAALKQALTQVLLIAEAQDDPDHQASVDDGPPLPPMLTKAQAKRLLVSALGGNQTRAAELWAQFGAPSEATLLVEDVEALLQLVAAPEATAEEGGEQ